MCDQLGAPRFDLKVIAVLGKKRLHRSVCALERLVRRMMSKTWAEYKRRVRVRIGYIRTLAASLTGSVVTAYRFTAGKSLVDIKCWILEKLASMFYKREMSLLPLIPLRIICTCLKFNCYKLLYLIDLIIHWSSRIQSGYIDSRRVLTWLPSWRIGDDWGCHGVMRVHCKTRETQTRLGRRDLTFFLDTTTGSSTMPQPLIY